MQVLDGAQNLGTQALGHVQQRFGQAYAQDRTYVRGFLGQNVSNLMVNNRNYVQNQ